MQSGCSAESPGFAAEGKGKDLIRQGATALHGSIPINPSGGLKAKGHPLGATGASQAVEVFKQLRGEAGQRQVKDASVGLTHNVGGSGSTCVVHIMRSA